MAWVCLGWLVVWWPVVGGQCSVARVSLEFCTGNKSQFKNATLVKNSDAGRAGGTMEIVWSVGFMARAWERRGSSFVNLEVGILLECEKTLVTGGLVRW